MISIVQGVYPDIAWDIVPEVADGKLNLPAGEVQVCNDTYQMEANSFEIAKGVVYLTPDGYVFIADDVQVPELNKFPNGENYWVCAINATESDNEDILVLKAVISA